MKRLFLSLYSYLIITVLLCADSSAEFERIFPQLTVATIEDIAYGNGRFVVISRSDQVLTTVDGSSWESAYAPARFSSIDFINGQFVALSDRDIYVSGDGHSWTFVSEAPIDRITGMAGNDGIFLLSGTDWGDSSKYGVYQSAALIEWSHTLAIPNAYSVHYAAGHFFVHGTSPEGDNYAGLYRSHDGIDWEHIPQEQSFLSLIGSGDRLYRQGIFYIQHSYDGIDWFPSPQGISDGLELPPPVAGERNTFLSNNRLFNWGPGSFVILDGDYWYEARWPDHVATSLGSGIRAIASSQDWILGGGAAGLILRSQDGQVWETLNPSQSASNPGSVTRISGAWHLPGTSDHSLLRTTDGKRWNRIELPAPPTKLISTDSYATMLSYQEAVSDLGHIFHSLDGLSWEHVQSFNRDPSNTRITALGDEVILKDAGIGYLHTINGRDWQVIELPDNLQFNNIQIAYNGYYFYGNGPGFWFSPSLSDWSQLQHVDGNTVYTIVPSPDRVLIEFAQGVGTGDRWFVYEAGGTLLLPLSNFANGPSDQVVWAEGYFWRRLNDGSVVRSIDAEEWETIEDLQHAYLAVSGSSIAFDQTDHAIFGRKISVRQSSVIEGFELNWTESTQDQLIDAGDTVEFEVHADTSHSAIDRVEFWLNQTLLEVVETSPYSTEIEFLVAGKYRVSARAYTQDGQVEITDPISISVRLVTLDSSLSQEIPEDVQDIAVFQQRLYLAGGHGPRGGLLWVSADGIQWNSFQLPWLNQVRKIVAGDTLLIASDDSGNYAISADGAQWLPVLGAANPEFFDGRVFWDRANRKWSEDGLSWAASSLGSLPLTDYFYTAVYFNGFHYAKVGESIWKSTDLEQWVLEEGPSHFWIVDDKLYRSTEPYNDVYVSEDGINWSIFKAFSGETGSVTQAGPNLILGMNIGSDLNSWISLRDAAPEQTVMSLRNAAFHNGLLWLYSESGLRAYGSPEAQVSIPILSALQTNDGDAVAGSTWAFQIDSNGDSTVTTEWLVNGVPAELQSDEEGSYHWSPSQPGLYEVIASLQTQDGHQQKSNPVYITVGKSVDIHLLSDIGIVPYHIEVFEDRILALSDNQIYVSFDGVDWHPLDAPGWLDEASVITRTRRGSLAQSSAGDLFYSEEWKHWEPMVNLSEEFGSYALVPSDREGIAFYEPSTRQLVYLGNDGSRFTTIAPNFFGLPGFVGMTPEKTWQVQGGGMLYGEDDGQWRDELFWLSDSIRLHNRYAWAPGFEHVHINKDNSGWRKLAPLVPDALVMDYLLHADEHYLISGEYDAWIFGFHYSPDGSYWTEIQGNYTALPKLFEFRQGLFLFTSSVSSIGHIPEPLSEGEIDLRLRLFGHTWNPGGIFTRPGSKVSYFLKSSDEWVWNRNFGWILPIGTGYPDYIFWSSHFDGWIQSHADYEQFWFHHDSGLWYRLDPADPVNPWRIVPSN